MKYMYRSLTVLLAIAIMMAGVPGIFAFAEAMDALTLPDALIVIEEEAFAGATSIGKVVVPEGTAAIRPRAFADSSLTEINLPESLIAIADDAFEGCADGLTVTAVEGSFAWQWAVNAGYIEGTGQEPVVADFTYFISNNAATITGYTGSDGDVIVPATIGNTPVTAIAAGAFDCSDVEASGYDLYTIVIPENVLTIESSAFIGCQSLYNVVLPMSLESIALDAFYNCYEDIYFEVYKGSEGQFWCEKLGYNYYAQNYIYTSDDFEYYINDDGTITTVEYTGADADAVVPSIINGRTVTVLGKGTFRENDTVSSVSLPDTLTAIEEMSFENCYGIREIEIPEGVVSIGREAFSECYSLSSVSLPSTLTYIEDNAFASCDNLTAFSVADASETYAVVNNALCTKDGAQLVCYPAGLSAAEYTTPAGMTEIGAYAFTGNDYLEKITVSEGVTTAGFAAFSNCFNLVEMNLPDTLLTLGDHAFVNCFSLMRVVLPESLTFIGDSAFPWRNVEYGDTPIVAVVVEGSYAHEWAVNHSSCTLEIIGAETEEPDLTNYTYTVADGEATITGYFGSESSVAVPAAIKGVPVTAIANNAFANRSAMTEIILPESLKSIGSFAFASSGLTSITFPKNVSSIGITPFFGSKELAEILVDDANATFKSVDGILFSKNGTVLYCCPQGNAAGDYEVPEGVTTIAANAFSHSSITSITLPSTLTGLGNYAFDYAYALTDIHVAEGNTSFYSDDGVLYNAEKSRLLCYPAGRKAETYAVLSGTTSIAADAFHYASALVEVSLPSTLTSIERYSFAVCSALTSVDIPDSVTEIDESAFYLCTSLKSAKLSSAMTAISRSLFYGCSALESISIPEGVVSIDSNAFRYCDALTSAVVPGTVTSVGDGIFADCPNLTIAAPVDTWIHNYLVDCGYNVSGV